MRFLRSSHARIPDVVRIITTAIAVASLGLASRLFAQQTAPPPPQTSSPQTPPPTFRSGVDLVLIDVTVVDKDGKPVKGLTADDFAVKLNGQRGAVRTIDFEEFGVTPGSTVETVSPTAPTTNQSPAAIRANRGGRVIVILFDDLSAKPGEAKILTVSAERMIASLDENDLVGLTTTSGFGPVLSPTRDRAALSAALHNKLLVGRYDDGLPPGIYISQSEAIEIDRGVRLVLSYVTTRECGGGSEQCGDQVRQGARSLLQQTIRREADQVGAYLAIIKSMQGAPKPRVIIALSNGLAVGAERGYPLELDSLSRSAAEVGVQFYALTDTPDYADARFQKPPAPPTVPPIYGSQSRARVAEADFLNAGIQSVASAMGGEAFKVIGQPDRLFKRILSETSGLYRLGVETPTLPGKTRFLDVSVVVNRPGVTIRTNRHALEPGTATGAASPASVDDALRNRLAQGGTAFAVPITLATALRRGESSNTQLQLAVDVQMPATVEAPLTTMFAVVDQAGKVVQSGRRVIAPPTGPATGAAADKDDYRLSFALPLAAGSYRLRFAAADARGQIGSVERRLNVELARIGPFAVSDLLTTSIEAGQPPRLLAVDALPAGTTIVRAAIELYPDAKAAPAPAITVRFTVTKQGETTPAVAGTDVTPTPNSSILTATTDIAVGKIPPGLYEIRAAILQAGVEIGAVITLVRKAG